MRYHLIHARMATTNKSTKIHLLLYEFLNYQLFIPSEFYEPNFVLKLGSIEDNFVFKFDAECINKKIKK